VDSCGLLQERFGMFARFVALAAEHAGEFGDAVGAVQPGDSGEGATGFRREEVYIANVLKCRPPENRDPQPDEMETCSPYLLEQIRLINPKFIVCLGRIAAMQLLETKLSLGRLRGSFHDFNGIKVMVTYHPAALLRFAEYKKDVWEDMKTLRKAYDGVELR